MNGKNKKMMDMEDHFLTMSIVLTFLVQVWCRGQDNTICGVHDMYKCCQHATNDSKVVGLTFIFIEKTQSILQKTITLTNNNEKGHKTSLNTNVPPMKLKF
jgi:hypothetical protein